jgi:AcrR family transcriptional regulator
MEDYMGIAERRQLEKEAIRKKIIDTASDILAKEGYESLSIRKIASRIEYSPGIIYHYFTDKAEVVASVVEEGYGKILKTISETPIDMDNPAKSIEKVLTAYINLMLEAPQQFRAVLMNDIEGIQDKVNMLQEGISKERKSIQGLCKLIEAGMEKGKFRKMDVELTAQIIWTSTHGLLSRLVLEKNVQERQKERLIEHHFDILIKGLLK